MTEVDPTRNGNLLDPSPRLVSNQLLGRGEKSDGTDDFHPRDDPQSSGGGVDPVPDPQLVQSRHAAPDRRRSPGQSRFRPETLARRQSRLLVRRTRADPTRKPNDHAGSTTFTNAEPQLVGQFADLRHYPAGREPIPFRQERQAQPRSPATKLIPLDSYGVEITGMNANWWLGLKPAAQSRRARAQRHFATTWWKHVPGTGVTIRNKDAQIFRVMPPILINNTALIAKIHTVDWTRAILTHPALQIGMNANWWGLAGENVKKYIGRISASEAISGIPGSAANQFDAD